MKTFNIDGTDVILYDLEEGRGKIIIADGYHGAYTHFWGSMGSKIQEFLCSMNSSYFADKLCSKTYEFDSKLTARNIRKHIRYELSYELPYWKHMSAQKELREKIKEIEGCSSSDEFIHICSTFSESLMCHDLSWQEEKEFKGIIEDVFKTEPWHFIGEKVTHKYKWLVKLHGKIKNQLSK